MASPYGSPVALYIGTSGWAYPEWRGSKDNPGKPAFYPVNLPQARFLEHYARHLSACEINATFYRIQPDTAVSRWAVATPPQFRFAAKGHRALTHSADVSPRGPLRALLDDYLSSLQALGPRLGVVLLQFPRHKTASDPDVVELLRAVGERTRFAAEFAGTTGAGAALDACTAAGGALCFSEQDGGGARVLAPGPVAYVRLRAKHYSEEARSAWCEHLRVEAAKRDVFVFTRHKDLQPDDAHGGIGLARWLETAARSAGSDDSP
jgi:uncharacterized protein YecE (DUF72 family)